MNLIDAGPLIALNDQSDPAYERCLKAFAGIRPLRFATTWPCVAEAMYFLGATRSFSRQKALWTMIRGGPVEIIDLSSAEIGLAERLMERYQDFPMDLADATLVAIADLREWRKVFTLDSHFFAYRLRDGSALDVILPINEKPEP